MTTQVQEEKREASSKMEGQLSSIWDQIRHVENSLSQRLSLAETSQVATLQVGPRTLRGAGPRAEGACSCLGRGALGPMWGGVLRQRTCCALLKHNFSSNFH